MRHSHPHSMMGDWSATLSLERTYKCIDILHFNRYAVLSPLAMRFIWDENKNRQNLRKHDVRFETAVLVFDDPYAITQRDVTFEMRNVG